MRTCAEALIPETVPLRELAALWERRATELEPYASPVAAAFRRAAAELEEALDAGQGPPVTLAEASDVSGYSVAHLRRLIGEGALRNVSENGRIRVRVGDLPRKLRRAS